MANVDMVSSRTEKGTGTKTDRHRWNIVIQSAAVATSAEGQPVCVHIDCIEQELAIVGLQSGGERG